MSGHCKDCGNQHCACDDIKIDAEHQESNVKKETKKESRKCLNNLLKVLNKKFANELKSLNLSLDYEKGYCSAFEEILELVQVYKEEFFKEKTK